MKLLFEEDYKYLLDSGLEFEEDFQNRFLIFKNYPVDKNLYRSMGNEIEKVNVLFIVPPNYNSSGGDMFWIHPSLTKFDGSPIPAVMPYGGGDPRMHGGLEFCRWSRHWQPNLWKPKIDNIQTILARIEWALRNPCK